MTRKSVNNPGEPNGVILSSATTVWLPVPPERLFSFLKDDRARGEVGPPCPLLSSPLPFLLSLPFFLFSLFSLPVVLQWDILANGGTVTEMGRVVTGMNESNSVTLLKVEVRMGEILTLNSFHPSTSYGPFY